MTSLILTMAQSVYPILPLLHPFCVMIDILYYYINQVSKLNHCHQVGSDLQAISEE